MQTLLYCRRRELRPAVVPAREGEKKRERLVSKVKRSAKSAISMGSGESLVFRVEQSHTRDASRNMDRTEACRL